MVQELCCVVVRVRAGSITHGADELAPHILAAYYVLYSGTIVVIFAFVGYLK